MNQETSFDRNGKAVREHLEFDYCDIDFKVAELLMKISKVAPVEVSNCEWEYDHPAEKIASTCQDTLAIYKNGKYIGWIPEDNVSRNIIHMSVSDQDFTVHISLPCTKGWFEPTFKKVRKIINDAFGVVDEGMSIGAMLKAKRHA